MKKLIFAAFVLLASVFTAAADDYTPTTTWPYVYSEFTKGEVMTLNGKTQIGLYNICLANSTLHFIDGDMVKEAQLMDVFSITIGKDTYVNLGGKVMKVLSKGEAAMVVEGYEIDYAKMNSATGAYGSSGNSVSTQALSSMEGIGGTRTNMNHMELRSNKESGTTLDLIVKKYLAVSGMAIPANKKEVLDAADARGHKAEMAAWMKENKVKWNSAVSLQDMANYLVTL